ncbi:serine hydrolase [Microbacterium sp. B35-04]|uniref:serine hydrolase domain-containing protein n=1 Tax=Microbacterium sp. B35-04 TaxID=1961716 RepID=UPI0013D061DF|nr:serine hydrolase domain-containing protein [Microbacterium sp. B35-04]KAF2411931.1 serine hydrolase [Microbacterium sp. B35-04]
MTIPITSEALDAAIEVESFSGVLTIDVGDRRTLERCEGFANRALRVPNTPSTRISAASGNKGFTALAILRLVEGGLLGLQDLVRPILGDDLPLIDDAVTIEHLLTHTSGIGDYLDEEDDGEIDDYIFSLPLHALADTEAFLPALDGFPQKFPPGERFSYCNGGYVVLALVAERVSGRGFHELVQTEVCDRAGLAGSAFLRSDDLPADAALGYLDEEGNRTNVLHLPVRGNGDGGMYFTADDLHRFWNALLDGRIVTPDTLAEMIRPRFDVPAEHKRYGMGLWLGRRNSSLILEGYDAGASFRSTHIPETRTTVTVLGNSSEGAWPVVYALADAMDGTVRGKFPDES